MGSLLICDLDGTLVDSFPGIAAALRAACESAGVAPAVPITRSLIGPPLDDLLRRVAGLDDPDTLARLARAFMAAYDGGACRLSAPFPGVGEMLEAVRSRGLTLALATNKRLVPTRAILDALGWGPLFAAVETLDSRGGKPRAKAGMLTDACVALRVDPRTAFYLGDTVADVHAAREAGMPCILATWGYDAASDAVGFTAATPRDIPTLIAGGASAM
jgi:phosphoglycolate phosphatase